MCKDFRRKDICWIDFGNNVGSEQSGIRPAIIIQNDIGNKYSPTIIVCPITSKFKKKELPTHVKLEDYKECGLLEESQVLTEQICTKDKNKITGYIGTVSDEMMDKIDKAIEISVNVGRAKVSYEKREIQVIKQKVDEIVTLDKFIRMWFTKNTDADRIKGYMIDREVMIKDLEKYARMNNINYREYYSPVTNSNMRMVG